MFDRCLLPIEFNSDIQFSVSMEPFLSLNLCDGCPNDSVSIILTDEESFTVTSALSLLLWNKAGYSIITGKLGLKSSG